MKKLILFLIGLFLIQGIQAQNTYYYYKGTKKELRTITNKQYILINNAIDTTDVKADLIKNGYSVENFRNVNVGVIPFRNKTINTHYWTIIETDNSKNALSTTNISYSAPYFLTQDSILVGLSHLFYVKLKTLNDTILLNKLAIENNVDILGNNKYMPLWFTLSCSKNSSGNALQMANLFYESKNFLASEPDILVDDYLSSVNDTYFSNQWGLNNTGQYGGTAGIDINYNQAHEITSGNSSIIVALLDQGVELNHPDLTNMYGLSYDTENGYSPSVVRGDHATACAGIIGANTNNGIGVAGIAPLCPIMSISNSFNSTPDSRIKRADGINFAWQNNASVISNSWGSSVQYSVIDDAINNALTQGRNGKGCVIVFASGNSNKSSVEYPSSVNGVISIGAVDRCGTRAGRIDIVPQSCDPWCSSCKPGSSYGDKLSVVAPGTNIYTTDRQGLLGYDNSDYTSSFGGTSAACPHVAAIAALILSVNPNLTQQQVRDIIESTAQKVRPDLYTYSTVVGHPNGTWNNQMGYGLVDAYAAVVKAQNLTNDLYIKDVDNDNGEEPSNTNGCMWESPDIWIEDMNGNIIDNPHGNMEYKVCVRVHNKKDISSSGTEKLYLNWTKAGVDLRWKDNWDGQHYFNCGALKGNSITTEAGVTIPSIPANSSAIVRVKWTTPNLIDYESCTDFGAEDKWHFCLLARVHDGNTIQNEGEDNTGMGEFVENNNNVAWKNLSILNSKYQIAVVSISNPFSTIRPFRLRYITYPNVAKEKLNKYAEVYLTLSNDLMKAWEEGKCSGKGFKRVSENKILLTSDTVILDNIKLDPNILYSAKTEVNFLTQVIPTNDTFSFDLSQYDISKDIELIGGEHYIAIRDNKKDFKAEALSDTTVFASEPATFTATTINENANYTWYNENGDTIATGTALTTTPTVTQKYKLEVVAQSNGFKDYDTVTATVRKGAITLLSPNPANNQVSITCKLASTINSAVIKLINTTGITVSTITINGTQTTTMNIQNFSSGQYTVQLLTNNGELLDSKVLIIQ